MWNAASAATEKRLSNIVTRWTDSACTFLDQVLKSTEASIETLESVDDTNRPMVSLSSQRQVGLRVQSKLPDDLKFGAMLDRVGAALQKLSQRKQTLLSKSADAKLLEPLEALRALNEQYQEICTDSHLAIADLKKFSTEIDLTTTLPSKWGCLKSMCTTLKTTASQGVLDNADKEMKLALVKMATTSALQLIARNDPVEASGFDVNVLQAVDAKLTDLPPAVVSALKALAKQVPKKD